MSSVLKYDKVVLVKEFGKLKTVGQTYEIANITEASFILRDAKTKVAIGVIDIKDFNEYFKKVEEVKGWTPWTALLDSSSENVLAFYRTNFKKVQVRTGDGVRAEASCNTMDEFNLYFGINLAYARCRAKFYNAYKENYENVLKEINSDIKQNNKFIKQMVDSLEDKVKK